MCRVFDDASGVRAQERMAATMTAIMESVRLSEDDWLGMITDLASLKGWHWLHLRPAMKRSGGWITAVAGDLGTGWPDLFLIRGREQLYVELKSESGQLTDEQRRVHELLRDSGSIVYVWRPADWLTAVEALT